MGALSSKRKRFPVERYTPSWSDDDVESEEPCVNARAVGPNAEWRTCDCEECAGCSPSDTSSNESNHSWIVGSDIDLECLSDAVATQEGRL